MTTQMTQAEICKVTTPRLYQMALECMDSTGKGFDEAVVECMEMIAKLKEAIETGKLKTKNNL